MITGYRPIYKAYYAVAILALIIIIGTCGFVILEDYSWLDGFYMTIITVSTVGFGEIHTLSPAGKIFTAFLIITSFGTFAFAIASITRYMVDGEYKTYFRNYKLRKKLNNMIGHTIICGYGRNGRQACLTLKAHNKNVIVLESDSNLEDQMKEDSVLYLIGDCTKESDLLQAGIKQADALITTLPIDSQNVFCVLTAREINPMLNIISRSSELSSEHKLRIAGADHVILPEIVGGAHMGAMVVTPDILEFLDHISVQGPAETKLETLTFTEFPEDLQHKSLKDINVKYQTGVSVIGIKTPAGHFIVNPSPDTEIMPGATLFVLGTPEQLRKLNEIFDVKVS